MWAAAPSGIPVILYRGIRTCTDYITVCTWSQQLTYILSFNLDAIVWWGGSGSIWNIWDIAGGCLYVCQLYFCICVIKSNYIHFGLNFSHQMLKVFNSVMLQWKVLDHGHFFASWQSVYYKATIPHSVVFLNTINHDFFQKINQTKCSLHYSHCPFAIILLMMREWWVYALWHWWGPMGIKVWVVHQIVSPYDHYWTAVSCYKMLPI